MFYSQDRDIFSTVIQNILYLSRFLKSCFCFDYVLYSLTYVGSRDLVRQWPAVYNQNKKKILNETFKTRWLYNLTFFSIFFSLPQFSLTFFLFIYLISYVCDICTDIWLFNGKLHFPLVNWFVIKFREVTHPCSNWRFYGAYL